jgi:pyroglutamyl-peptidase
METITALVTGFEPYGGRSLNPSAEVMRRLNGSRFDDITVVGRSLPVAFAQLSHSIRELITTVKPDIAISLGLWPGEPLIRIERVAVNLADFEIPDNEGCLLADTAVDSSRPDGLFATLPVRQIEQSLLRADIPARISNTAGSFLCNATLFTLLAVGGAIHPNMRAGFIHLPYLPAQVAALLAAGRQEHRLEIHQRADLASMSLDLMVEAVRIALTVTAAATKQA